MAKLLIAVLTKDEELNLPVCLRSTVQVDADVTVIDSGSTDTTVEIAREAGANVAFHEFISFASQRNWVIDNLAGPYDWVLFLDADERLTAELAAELANLPERNGATTPAGYYINREFWFLGHPLRHGPYGNNRVMRLLDPRHARVDEQSRNLEYAAIDGVVGELDAPMIHENHRPLTDWVMKHDWYSSAEAEYRLGKDHEKAGAVSEHKVRAWLRRKVLVMIPPTLLPFTNFFYRYFVQAGFLDGRVGFIYYVLHDFWYPFLTAAKIVEIKENEAEAG